ncbi:hypothetical protein [Lyngbya confervoides]|uniref:Uncharacterized protein n=1 Tax=Lyngbya confervoides BDU141951 TaxID=1574623 RepID=A0ABD4T511_9CYAN|nr:hypothetical protein [Lyngbya confervoides]MCM1983746.1 hypothetical protein [Lyngbya confervoides BDU141951]
MTDHPEHSIPGWLELHDLSLHADSEARSPYGLYLTGRVGPGHRFRFKGSVSGTPIAKPPQLQGTPGWLEINTLTFHPEAEARPPHPPYLPGIMDHANHFYPDEPYEVVTDLVQSAEKA